MGAAALSGFGATAPRRPPAEVTADRLVINWTAGPDRFNGTGQDAIARIRGGLQRIAAGA